MYGDFSKMRIRHRLRFRVSPFAPAASMALPHRGQKTTRCKDINFRSANMQTVLFGKMNTVLLKL